MGIIKFKICDKVITLQENEEITNLLREDDAFTVQFFETAMQEGRLRKFGILTNEIDNVEIIRLEQNTSDAGHNYGDTEVDSETMSPTESSFEESIDAVGPISIEKENGTWTKISTKLLLNLYVEHLKKVGKSSSLKNKKSLWKLISEEMLQQGYNFSPTQVENRYKTLDRGYKTKTVNNNKTGRNRASCDFQSELDEIYEDNRAVYPEYILGSSGSGKNTEEIKKSSMITTETTPVSGESSSSQEQNLLSNEADDGGKRRTNKSRTILEEIKQLRQIREDELELKKQREIERKKFRSELLQLEREKLEAYKERNNLFKDHM